MEKSGKVKNRGGITTVGKDPNLVSWDLGYRRDENDVVLDVFITFSSKARAKTGRGDKQDSHTSAYALHLAQTMKIVKDTVPKEENDFRGLNNLVNEMALIPQRDFFLLEKFNVMPKHTEELVPAEFKNNTSEKLLELSRLPEFKNEFSPFPFGSDFTKEEENLVLALEQLKEAKKKSALELFKILFTSVGDNGKFDNELNRMNLLKPKNLKEKIYRKLILYYLNRII